MCYIGSVNCGVLLRTTIVSYEIKRSLMRSLYLLLLSAILVLSCGRRSSAALRLGASSNLDAVIDMMTGSFDSSAQAARDSAYYDISLEMHEIWQDRDPAVRWLYVEQAVSSMKDRPYRQRVYRVAYDAQRDAIESRVYELPDPEKYVFAWQDGGLFDQLDPDALILREGCSVYLTSDGGCYEGSTEDDACKSSLRGASYATSSVQICAEGITSWDQGWDDTGTQVWGAVDGGYVFLRRAE